MYDVIMIGGGTGGYTAAIRAAKSGLNVLIIEKHKLGGTCLHQGCIPTKTMLEFSGLYSKIVNKTDEMGIEISDSPKLNVEKLMKRKTAIIDQLHSGIEFLMKKNKVDIKYGSGKIKHFGSSLYTVEINSDKGQEEYTASKVIIATGSKPLFPQPLKVIKDRVMSSDEIISIKKFPKSIAILGGGVIGIEFATFFNEIGCEVKIIERADRILPSEDEEISKELKRVFQKKKIEMYLDSEADLETISSINKGVEFKIKDKKNENKIEAEMLLVAVGRKNNIDSLGLEELGIDLSKGYIPVNEYMETSLKGLYAIGDITGFYQLAHVAAHQGIIAVDHMTNSDAQPYQSILIPRCVYSHPEVASLGLTEREAKNKGIDIKVGKFNFKGIARALIHSETDGFVKMICDKKTDQIIGIHMIGKSVTELIGESALGALLQTTAWEVSTTVHPHPSLNEIFGEAALAVEGQEING